MDFKFKPSEGALPLDQVHVVSLSASPWPDGKRVRVSLELSPFKQPPNLLLVMQNPQGEEVSRILFVETQETSMTFTMHIRAPSADGEYSLTCFISYPEMEAFNPFSTSFSIPLVPSE